MDEVFWDTSGIKALVDNEDTFHEKAAKIWGGLGVSKAKIILNNFVIDEAYTLLRKRCGIRTVRLFRNYLVDMVVNNIVIERVKVSDEVKAWWWFDSDWSDLSFTDCVSFAMMKRLEIKKYFGFDEHFDRAGFVKA